MHLGPFDVFKSLYLVAKHLVEGEVNTDASIDR